MYLKETAPVAVAALPLAALREELRLASGFGTEGLQDDQLERCLRAALAQVENRCRIATLTRRFAGTVLAWRGAWESLGLRPITALEQVILTDAQGATTDVTDQVKLAMDWLAPVGSSLPVVPRLAQVRVEVTAGFGAWGDIPADLAQGVVMMAAQLYDGGPARGAEIEALLAPYAVAGLGRIGA